MSDSTSLKCTPNRQSTAIYISQGFMKSAVAFRNCFIRPRFDYNDKID
jgi:hypothetical protein